VVEVTVAGSDVLDVLVGVGSPVVLVLAPVVEVEPEGSSVAACGPQARASARA
jgi:hypothetical protein